MSRPVGWGILGAGRISTVAVGPALAASPSCRLVAVGSRHADRAARLAASLSASSAGPAAAAYGSYEQVVTHPEVEAVYIALPNDAHVPWALEALRAGRHVLCEKPFGMHLDQVRSAFDAAEAAGLVAAEAAWNRWHPRSRDAERLVAGGALGEVRSIDAGFVFCGVDAGDYRMDPGRGGGALYDVGCYALSAVGWATGWAPLSGCHPEVRRHPGGVDLATAARLEVAGATATIRAAIDEPDRQWIEVTGTDGVLRFGPPAFTAWSDGPASLELARTDGPVESRHFQACNPYLSMVEAVSARVRGGDAWLVPRRDSEWVAAAIDAVGYGRLPPG
ncbi:MAG TPA: Gfo/Idh/MocA family oxidoreductase [Acidimicrobiales bacterium]|nr:Gfo/Idh/MocA family oxidoreductase [Acidimicrobiales bacterium]